jgi:hypothetical protein
VVRIIGVVAAPLSLLLYAVVGAAWAGVAWWLGRPIPRRFLLAFLLLPVLFLFPAFVTTRTIFPVDHAMSLPPWNALPHSAPANPNTNDVATQAAPWAKAVRMAWKEGSFPWRNRWNAGGTPLAANGQSAAFSPLTMLTFLLPLVATFNFLVAVKLFTALAGTWLWLCEMGIRARAAAFGAILSGFSFTMVPWLLFPHTGVIALWPWALFAIERLRDPAVRGRATAVLGAVWILQILGGHPESLVLGVLFTAVWLASRFALGDLSEVRPVLARSAAAGLLALAICGFFVVPHALAIRDSNRTVNAVAFADALPVRLSPHGPAWPWGIFTAVLPRSLGDAMATPMLSVAGGSFPEMALGHFGLAGLAAALLIFRKGSRRPRAEIALAIPLVLGFAAAILLWPVFDVLYVLPGIRLMLPLRFFTWVAFAGSAIAAFEIDRLETDVGDGRASGRAFLVTAGALLVLAAGFLAKLAPLHAAAGALGPQRRAALVAGVFLIAAALFAAALLRRGARETALPLCLAFLAAGELFWQGRRLYRLGPAADFYPQTPLVEFLRRQAGPFRILGEGAMLFPGTNVFAGVEEVRSHDPVERRDYVEWLDRACGYDPAAYFKNVANLDCAALDLLNVKYLAAGPGRGSPGPRWKLVYSAGDGTVFENSSARPRVFPIRGAARIADYRETTNGATFRADVGGETAELGASLVQDGGWTARDETGARLPVARANGPFLTVTVPGGSHRVRLGYVPPGLPPGVALSAAGVVLSGLAVFGRRRRGAGARQL